GDIPRAGPDRPDLRQQRASRLRGGIFHLQPRHARRERGLRLRVVDDEEVGALSLYGGLYRRADRDVHGRRHYQPDRAGDTARDPRRLLDVSGADDLIGEAPASASRWSAKSWRIQSITARTQAARRRSR